MNVADGQSPDLISFTPEVEQVPQKSPQNPLGDVNSDLPKPATQKNYSRLCGYLNKVGNRGILKTIRKRWFVFSEDRCKLYYYRSSQDLVPLGAIDISQATFSFDVSNKEKAGAFVISVPDKKIHLEASDRQTCLFWLQELQKFRRTNSLQRTELIRGRSGSHSSFEKPSYGGLLGNSSFSANSIDCSKEETLLMDPVDCPGDSIGETVPETSNKPLLIAQQKFSNLRNQVLNSVNAIRQDKNSSETQNIPVNGSMFSQEKRLSGYSLQNSTFFDNLPTDTCTIETSCPNKTCPPSPKKNQGLSAIRTKISESFRKQKCSEEEEPIAVRKPSKKYSCSACQDNTKTIQLLQNEISSLQDEVSVSRSLIKTLQKQLDIVLKEKETIIHLRQMDDSSDMLEILNSKDCEIINLRHDIQEQKQEVENLHKQVLSIKRSLQEQTDLYQELLQQKDSQIIMLTNEVFDLESEKRDQECKQKHSNSISSLNGSKSSECLKDLDDSENLKDAVQAYELQNKFLNKELLELNQLRSDAEQREYVLTLQCNEWEARCCQIQSKFLYLLKELEKPDSNEKSQELVSRLLREATADNADSSEFHPSWAIEKVYDDLGFNYKWGKEDLLLTKAANFKQRSDDIANKAKQESETVLLRAKWDNFMVTVGNKELQLTPELKLLLRQGIPHEYKGRIWKGCVEMRIKFLKLKLGEGYYDKLVYSEEYVSRLDPSSKQIELDLLRTLPNNQHYEDLDADGIPKLRRVLLAYSRHDPIVGYCQGLNRLAAIALLFLEEEDAFWCLITIIKYLMPEGYYSRSLMAAQVDQRVLKDLMSDKLPRLHSHLDQYKVDLSLFTFNWFLTIFIDNIPIETSLRIWDVFLFEGSKVLFRYALAFFKICEADVLALKDYIVINKYLRTIAETMTDVKRLNQIAFSELNPFPQRVINAKRAQHMQIVKAELEELEKLRNSLPRNVEKCVSPDCPSEED